MISKKQNPVNEYTKLLLELNFEHWSGLNPYFSSDTTNIPSIKRILTNIQKQGLLTDFKPKTAMDIVDEINSCLGNFKETDVDYELLAKIFDLIQVWGGQTGRGPYVITKSRYKFNEWRENYLYGALMALNNNPVGALKEWMKISGVGMSFAPKHLRFWSKKYPVLDTRISLLMCGSRRLLGKPDCYSEFLGLIEPLADNYSCPILEAEKALFAFSQNYFVNDRLEFKSFNFDTTVNYDIAKKLIVLNPE